MSIKIESKKLKNYVEKATLKGGIKEFIMEFKESGLNINVKNQEGSNAVISQLNKEAFDEYNVSEGKYGINDANKFISIVSTFEGIVNVDLQENLLTIYNANKSASIVLKKPEFITETALDQEPESFEQFDEGFDIDSKNLKETIENMKILSNKVNFKVENNLFYIQTGKKNFDTITQKIDCNYKDVKSSFENSFICIVPVLEGTVNFSILEDEGPLKITMSNEDMQFKFLAGPSVQEEE